MQRWCDFATAVVCVVGGVCRACQWFARVHALWQWPAGSAAVVAFVLVLWACAAPLGPVASASGAP
jgi:hypothetical protein